MRAVIAHSAILSAYVVFGSTFNISVESFLSLHLQKVQVAWNDGYFVDAVVSGIQGGLSNRR